MPRYGSSGSDDRERQWHQHTDTQQKINKSNPKSNSTTTNPSQIYVTVPDKVLGGILPPYRTGGPVASNVAKMKIDG